LGSKNGGANFPYLGPPTIGSVNLFDIGGISSISLIGFALECGGANAIRKNKPSSGKSTLVTIFRFVLDEFIYSFDSLEK